MSRKGRLADMDPFSGEGGGEEQPTPASASTERPSMSMSDADMALFGELSKREGQRQIIRPISIFNIYPDVKQPRRAVPSNVRSYWSGEPKDIADLFNAWLQQIDAERKQIGRSRFNLDDVLWAEAVESRGRDEDEHFSHDDAGPIEKSFLKVIELAISIRRDGLANPVTIQRTSGTKYRLETGERRWLAFHILFGYFNGGDGKPQERERWENVPAIIVDDFSVWRQASENAARADLNAIGRARQFAILLMDLLERSGTRFRPYEAVVNPTDCDRRYYAQVIEHRVPTGRSDMLSNGLGVSHRAAFSRCRTLLGLPDEVWTIGDNLDFSEDELLRIAKIEPPAAAVEEARRLAQIVATRNNSPSAERPPKKHAQSPALFADDALTRGKRLFTKQDALIAKQVFDIRDGVGQASPATKGQLRQAINDLRNYLNKLEEVMDSDN